MTQGESESRLTEADLSQFTGTSQWYTHPLGLMYTDGVQYLADQAGAYWLLDAIASWQFDPRVPDDRMLQQIQFWKLTVNSDRSAVLVCERDSDDVAVMQKIPSTNFSLQSVTIYCKDGVLLLPSEY